MIVACLAWLRTRVKVPTRVSTLQSFGREDAAQEEVQTQCLALVLVATGFRFN